MGDLVEELQITLANVAAMRAATSASIDYRTGPPIDPLEVSGLGGHGYSIDIPDGTRGPANAIS